MKKVSKAKPKVAGKKRVKKSKYYSLHVLVIAIALLVAGESVLILNTSSSDWSAGLAVLDVSDSVSSTIDGLSFFAQPATSTYTAVNDFYTEAAVASTQLLDTTSNAPDTLTFVYGVNDFYQVASNQLANLLDLSNYTSSNWQPQVAGASIVK